MGDVATNSMTCFKILKIVLDKMYEQLPTGKNYVDKDAVIQERLDSLRDDYKKLIDGTIPKYYDSYKRFAYLYRYVAAHANIVYELINLSIKLKNVFEMDEVNVSCIGGGPASELLGIQKFMKRTEKTTTIHYYILDRQDLWRDYWHCICENLDSPFKASSSFQTFDVADSLTWSKFKKLWNAELFTLSFFMSEVFPIQERANVFFETMFEQAKTGAFFLFIDNISVGAESWFDSLVEKHNKSRKQGRIEVIRTSDSHESGQYVFQMEHQECKEDLIPFYGRYYDRFRKLSCPRLQANVVFRICRKV